MGHYVIENSRIVPFGLLKAGDCFSFFRSDIHQTVGVKVELPAFMVDEHNDPINCVVKSSGVNRVDSCHMPDDVLIIHHMSPSQNQNNSHIECYTPLTDEEMVEFQASHR